jgi:hypothetical protein
MSVAVNSETYGRKIVVVIIYILKDYATKEYRGVEVWLHYS